MKIYNKLIVLMMFALCISACDELDENLQNPTQVTPEGASLDDVYNSVQLTMRNIAGNMWYWPASLSRMTANTSAYQYIDASNAGSFNGIWSNVYSGLWADIQVVEDLAEPIGLDVHVGSVKVMKAYSMMLLVDVFGDVPYSEALQGTDVIAPNADSGADIYAAAITLLDEAITVMTGTDAAGPAYDNFYDGDADNWIKLANTLKLRAALTTRLVNGNAAAQVDAAVAAGVIEDESEDWQFSYGNNRVNPNSRHPNYNNSYETSDGAYMSNYYMWKLRADKEDGGGNPFVDPRIRYYFYRQVEEADAQDASVYSCHFSQYPDQSAQPDWYADIDPRLPYCIVYPGDGYLGRDHLNNEGIPPDGPIRTIYGLYPFGGQFDDNSFEDQQQQGTTGALGQGIWPLMLSTYVDFLRAEASLTLGTADDARTMLESGMQKSFAKVIGFESKDPGTFSATVTLRDGSSGTVQELYGSDQDDVDNYIDYVLDAYDNATTDDERLDIIMTEYYIALWGNGIESYNMYRRTGKPGNMAPALEQGPGEYMRSFFLPADHVTRNPNASQKSITDQVFWDNGSATVY
ncbi:SusD/RagB family nutrient-binding outer membrane lipoprotein [Roseivirga pacifica]|uniref:SusD/RagB family nutrient-binding outer membrane lipoprotein n=1 Tax=Roseivirga pacifica TaxID=1267423 RepID=UPI00227B2237|nr:SusD/RagB family nutrient-binding outer membrane lipoprotein [Roseivirga pacifica]